MRMVFTLVLTCSAAMAGQPFTDLVGNVPTGKVQWDEKSPLRTPYITWGGESATFAANGLSLKTTSDSIYGKMGVNLDLVNGDDFVQQVRDYKSGKSPFLRGTYRMIGMAAESVSQDPDTQPICILQMTWSLGDHIVSRQNVKTLADLKGTTGIIQTGGPHVGLVDDALKAANLTWNDINVIWAKDLSITDQSPAAMFRNTPNADWCCVISPDMIGLTGGLQATGSGAEGTIKGAHVVVSTSELSRSIADTYWVRKDFYQNHRDLLQKFVAGYLQGCNRVIELRKAYEDKGSKDYENLLKFMQLTFGKEVCPSLDPDTHGMILDLNWVGLPGNVAFFTETNNPNGFEAFAKNSIDMATAQGYAKNLSPTALIPAQLDYSRIASLGGLGQVQIAKTGSTTKVVRKDKFKAEAVEREIENFNQEEMDSRTIYSFTVNFEPNQITFPVRQYEKELSEVASKASKFGNAIIAVRGHSDPSKTLMEMVRAGMKNGILKRSGSKESGYRYSLKGQPFDITNTKEIVSAIERGDFDGVAGHNPRDTYQAAVNLSRRRAENFIDSLASWCEKNDYPFDKSQIKAQGVGIREPFIARPRNFDDAMQNMRVEFRLVRVDAEAQQADDFDF